MSDLRFDLYVKPHCSLCEDAKSVLKDLQTDYTFSVKEIDIEEDEAFFETYGWKVPVLEMNGETVDYGKISAYQVKKYL